MAVGYYIYCPTAHVIFLDRKLLSSVGLSWVLCFGSLGGCRALRGLGVSGDPDLAARSLAVKSRASTSRLAGIRASGASHHDGVDASHCRSRDDGSKEKKYLFYNRRCQHIVSSPQDNSQGTRPQSRFHPELWLYLRREAISWDPYNLMLIGGCNRD